MPKPWHDPDWLKEQYIDHSKSFRQIADEQGVSGTTIRYWYDKHDLPRREKRYQDAEWLDEQHNELGKSLAQIGREQGVTGRTICEWCDRLSVPTQGVGGENPHPNIRTAPESTDSAGYVFARTKHNRTEYRVRIHRLLAVAEYGYDEVVEMDVHHKNRIPWDNRPENIELVTNKEHARLHADNRARTADGDFA